MSQAEIFIKMTLDRWNGSIENMDKCLNALSDEQLLKEIVPGRNRGIYLLGHLIAVHDDMLRLLNWGDKQYPNLHEPFIKEADNKISQIPTVANLRSMWTKQCVFMQEKIAETTINDWFSKHAAVSEEDFIKEPHRNKLNIIVSRTSHLQYHTGQLVLLQSV